MLIPGPPSPQLPNHNNITFIDATAYSDPRLQDQSLNISCEESAMTLSDCELSLECINSQSAGTVQCQPRMLSDDALVTT